MYQVVPLEYVRWCNSVQNNDSCPYGIGAYPREQCETSSVQYCEQCHLIKQGRCPLTLQESPARFIGTWSDSNPPVELAGDDRKFYFYYASSTLSRFHFEPFLDGNNTFTSIFQYVHYRRAIHIGDPLTARQILKEFDPHFIAAIGKRATPTVGREDISYRHFYFQAITLKFKEGSPSYARLLRTYDDILCEASISPTCAGITMKTVAECSAQDRPLPPHNGSDIYAKALMRFREACQSRRTPPQ